MWFCAPTLCGKLGSLLKIHHLKVSLEPYELSVIILFIPQKIEVRKIS